MQASSRITSLSNFLLLNITFTLQHFKNFKQTSKISIILKNLFFISCFVKSIFYFAEEKQGMERTSGDERKHEISETFSPLYTSRFFLYFFLYLPLEKRRVEEKMVKILNLLDHDKSRKDF